jgi:flagellin-like protein
MRGRSNLDLLKGGIKMNNKKGISAIVATVLIILITVAAVTIIWAAIIPMINNQLNKGTICLDAVSQVSLSDAGYTCKNVDAGGVNENLSIQIRHGALEFDLADVQVIISAGGDSTSFLLSDEATTLAPSPVVFPGSNEEKVYTIDTTGISGEIDSVQIAPIVRVGNARETCEISATRTLREC